MTGNTPARRTPRAWAHGPGASTVRGWILVYLLRPIVDHYTSPTIMGREHLARIQQPVVFAANHSSHIDTPLLLQSLPEEWRRRTAVAAAADYFFRNNLIAWAVSLAFGAVPIERNARISRGAAEGLTDLVRSDLNVLVYPEGTRSRDGSMGALRSGAARLALERDVPIVPIYLTGTHEAMPPGRWWPRRHHATVVFGEALIPRPGEEPKSLTARLQAAFSAMRTALAKDA